MTEKNQAPKSEGTASESHEYVSGPGGPNFTQGGMMPGGDEMENWKKVNPNDPDAEQDLQEAGENLRQRVENN